MKAILMFIVAVPSICLIICVILYALNRKNYYRLLDSLQKNYTLPIFYVYYANRGFIGGLTMSYLFIGLKKKKRLIYIAKDSDLYDFPEKNGNKDLINSVMPFYYTFLTGLGSIGLMFFIVLIIKIKELCFPG